MERLKVKMCSENKSFHESMAFTLVIGQIFGLMPVDGVTSNNERLLCFRWKSFKVFYSVALTLSLLFPMYASMYDVATNEANIDRITAVIFFGNSITVHISFIVLAKNWAKFIEKWHYTELTMKTYGYPKDQNWRIKTMTVFVLTLAILEHLLSLIEHFLRADEFQSNDQDIFEYFFVVIAFPQVFFLFRYSVWLGIFVITFMSTFSWTYIDLFIMLMSTSLSLRFQQIADRVELYSKSNVTNQGLWKNLREDYARLTRLCKTLNENISGLVMLSFASNLYFILVQLFHSLKMIQEVTGKIYFFFSFGFLIGRAVCVCLYGAWIYDESRRPLLTLTTLSGDIYNTEIKRLTMHVCFAPVALTGKNFFVVTRGLILSIAGAIMTYELVLIQYFGTFQTKANRNETLL